MHKRKKASSSELASKRPPITLGMTRSITASIKSRASELNKEAARARDPHNRSAFIRQSKRLYLAGIVRSDLSQKSGPWFIRNYELVERKASPIERNAGARWVIAFTRGSPRARARVREYSFTAPETSSLAPDHTRRQVDKLIEIRPACASARPHHRHWGARTPEAARAPARHFTR